MGVDVRGDDVGGVDLGGGAARGGVRPREGAPQLLKVLGEPVRWAIVSRLAAEDLCTCHLVEDLGVAQPLISHHLRVLREAGVVHAEPAGAFTYYVLDRAVVAGLAATVGALAGGDEAPSRRACP
jgi:ArsR family transcriptional regulator